MGCYAVRSMRGRHAANKYPCRIVSLVPRAPTTSTSRSPCHRPDPPPAGGALPSCIHTRMRVAAISMCSLARRGGGRGGMQRSVYL